MTRCIYCARVVQWGRSSVEVVCAKCGDRERAEPVSILRRIFNCCIPWLADDPY